MTSPTPITTYPEATDGVVFSLRNNELQLLVIKRGIAPHKGQYALPGGFRRDDETTDQTILREIAEEVGVNVLTSSHMERLNWYDDPHRDPRGPVTSFAYLLFVPADTIPTADTDAAEALYLPVGEALKPGVLAFDHQQIVADALERARNRLEYTTLATKLLPDMFTLGQLRHVYETVWGRPLHKSNFQRKVENTEGFVTKTGWRDNTPNPGPKGYLYRAGNATELYPPIQRSHAT